MNRGRNDSILSQPDLHLSVPTTIPCDPFSPLPDSQARKYLFRVVWSALSPEEQRQGKKTMQAEMRKASPPPSEPALLMLSQFDYHLSDARYGDCATPFTSWYASYNSAATRAETLRSRGLTNIQILVVWAEGLCVFDGYAAARALGYRDEAVNGNAPAATAAVDTTAGAANRNESLTPASSIERPAQNVDTNITGIDGDDSGKAGNDGRLDPMKTAGVVPCYHRRRRVLSDHAGEFLLLGTQYVEEQHLVTHFDWHGPIDCVSDRSGAGVKVPRWLVFPEPEQVLKQQRHYQHYQHHQQQQHQQHQHDEVKSSSPSLTSQFHKSQLNLSSMQQPPSKPESAHLEVSSRPIPRTTITFATSSSSSSSSIPPVPSASSLHPHRRRVLVRGRRGSIYERKRPAEPNSNSPQLGLLKSTKGIRESLRALSTMVSRNPQSLGDSDDGGDGGNDDNDNDDDDDLSCISTRREHRNRRHSSISRILSPNTPLTRSPLSLSPASSLRSSSSTSSSKQRTYSLIPPPPAFSPLTSSRTSSLSSSPSSSIRSPRFTRNNSVISTLLSQSPLSRPERYPLPDWNELVRNGDDSSDDEIIIAQRMTGRATKPRCDGSEVSGGSGGSGRSRSSSRSGGERSGGISRRRIRRKSIGAGVGGRSNGGGANGTETAADNGGGGSYSGESSSMGVTSGSGDSLLRASVCRPPGGLYLPVTPSGLFRAVAERVYLRRYEVQTQTHSSRSQHYRPHQPQHQHSHPQSNQHQHQQQTQEHRAMTTPETQPPLIPSRKIATDLLQVMGVHYHGDVFETARVARLDWEGRWCWISRGREEEEQQEQQRRRWRKQQLQQQQQQQYWGETEREEEKEEGEKGEQRRGNKAIVALVEDLMEHELLFQAGKVGQKVNWGGV